MDQLVEEYLSHDAFVLPSRQEGFGIVVAEAFHAGLPVISTRCGGPEDFIVKSEAGLLVDHGEVSIAAAIETLASNDDLRMRCAANAFRYAAAELSFSIFAGRVRSLTDDLVREGRSSEARGKNRSA
jgi:glycosyltransferase involved in cell wall biosynthesis